MNMRLECREKFKYGEKNINEMNEETERKREKKRLEISRGTKRELIMKKVQGWAVWPL